MLSKVWVVTSKEFERHEATPDNRYEYLTYLLSLFNFADMLPVKYIILILPKLKLARRRKTKQFQFLKQYWQITLLGLPSLLIATALVSLQLIRILSETLMITIDINAPDPATSSTILHYACEFGYYQASFFALC